MAKAKKANSKDSRIKNQDSGKEEVKKGDSEGEKGQKDGRSQIADRSEDKKGPVKQDSKVDKTDSEKQSVDPKKESKKGVEKKEDKKAEKEKSEDKKTKKTPKKVEYSVDLNELLESGAHFGHQVRRWNPAMAEYIYVKKDGVHIFDLTITGKKIVEAMNFVRDWVASGKDIVFVGTKRQAQAIVREEAIKVGAPLVSHRWLGGTLTNWSEMKKRIKKLNDLKDKKERGVFDEYTKKEQVILDREISRLERFFGGLTTLKNGPQALFVVDTHRERVSVLEAKKMGVPVVGLVDSNGDPDLVDHIIPLNDDSVRTIKIVVEKISQAYADGKELRKSE